MTDHAPKLDENGDLAIAEWDFDALARPEMVGLVDGKTLQQLAAELARPPLEPRHGSPSYGLARASAALATFKKMALRDWQVFGSGVQPEVVSPRELAIRRVTLRSMRSYEEVRTMFAALERSLGMTHDQVEASFGRFEQLPMGAFAFLGERGLSQPEEYCEHVDAMVSRRAHRSAAAKRAAETRKTK